MGCIWRGSRRSVKVLRVTSFIAAVLLLPGSQTYATAQPQAPQIVSLTTSASSLPAAGGPVTVSGAVSGANSCKLSSNPALKGLGPVPCSQFSAQLTVGANSKLSPLIYKITLTASGKSGKSTATVSFSVARLMPPAILAFEASPATIPYQGGAFQISGHVAASTSCRVAVLGNLAGYRETGQNARVAKLKLPASSVSCTGFQMSVPVPTANRFQKSIDYELTLTAKNAAGTVNSVVHVYQVSQEKPTITQPMLSLPSVTSEGGLISGTVAMTSASSCWVTVSPSWNVSTSISECASGAAKFSVRLPVNTSAARIMYSVTVTAYNYGGDATASATILQSSRRDDYAYGPFAGVALMSPGNRSTCATLADSRGLCWGRAGRATAPQFGSKWPTAVRKVVSNDYLGPTWTINYSCCPPSAELCIQVDCDNPPVFAGFALLSVTCVIELDGAPSCEQPGGASYLLDGLPHPATDIAVGEGFACALLNSGDVYCWLTDSTDGTVLTPTPTLMVRSTVSLAAAQGACAVLATGDVECWKYSLTSDSYRYGGWSWETSAVERVPGVTTAVQVSVGRNHACVVLSDATVKCWGANDKGQTGIDGLQGVAAVAAGADHACALMLDESVQCSGYNDRGQLGNGTRAGSSIPVVVAGLGRTVAISAGGNHTCALTADGNMYCWGENFDGELGTDLTDDSPLPALVVARLR